MPLPHAGSKKSTPKQPTLRRHKLWELQSRFHCSVIGNCLSLAELRRLCRKANITFATPVGDYHLHSAFVNIAAESAYPSRLLQKHLDSKYRRIIHQLLKVHAPNELQLAWLEAIKSGEVSGAFWALLTHPRISDELLDQLYGDMHMLSHLAGLAVRVDMQAFTRSQQLTATLSQQLAASQAKTLQRDHRIHDLQKQLTQAKSTVQKLNKTQQQLQLLTNEPHAKQLQQQASAHAEKLSHLQTRAERAENMAEKWQHMALEQGDQHLRLDGKLANAQAERDALEATLEKILTPDCSHCSTQEACLNESINLAGRCILYVGGRNRLCAHFRALVERQNGQFIHHDGGLQDGRLHLASILPQADAVLCPLDCVSHDAVRRVKRFCHRYSTPLILLHRDSLSAFVKGLAEVAA
jgi:hypothetical protein